MNTIFKNVKMPAIFNEELKVQIERLRKARKKFREDIISPFKFLDT